MPRLLTTSAGLIASLATAGGLAVAVPAPVEARPAPALQRVVTVAKSYVGKVRYREGGASPKRGFDCSGYTKYVYAKARVATLPHNAEAQRHLGRMHRVSRKHAVPGDLVFYGKPAFHVAIYAGKGKQYAAATSGTKIKKQRIWSSDVTFGHLTAGR